MPSTRLSKRSSEASRVSVEDRPLPSLQNETLETLSTAALPPAYSITLARPTGDDVLDNDREAEEYRRGQEYLNDGTRRIKDTEGDLRDLVRARKRRRLSWDREAGAGITKGQQDGDVLWYTASLRHACSCDLQLLNRSFTLRRPPPARRDLSSLPHVSDPTESIQLASDVPEWADKEDYTDLEPALDALREFELGWPSATGEFWQSQGIGKFCDAIESDLKDTAPVTVAGQAVVLETPEGRWLRKGKFKAIDILPHPLRREIPDKPDKIQDVVFDTPYPPARVDSLGLQPAETTKQERLDWEQESKRRKQLWRGLIGKDPGYCQFWETLPRPHTYANLGALPDIAKPPDYNLFRNYHTAAHPFHPDLSRYISKNSEARVYWLIPTHGPVIVQCLNDAALSPTHRAIEGEIPIPSSATFHIDDATAVVPTVKVSRPAPITWTPLLLSHFVQSFLLPLRQSRLYGLSVAFSGPKPDPFIALVPPAPLRKHQYAGKARLTNRIDLKKPAAKGDEGTPAPSVDRTDVRPVRVEAGDHVRLYCDASEALSLRTWLHGVHVDIDKAGVAGARAKGRRLFDKVRLCLIGQRGEVLIVA